MKIGRITLTDRASQGVCEDKSGPEIEKVIASMFEGEQTFIRVLIPDDPKQLLAALLPLVRRGKMPARPHHWAAPGRPERHHPGRHPGGGRPRIAGLRRNHALLFLRTIQGLRPVPRRGRRARPEPDHQSARPPKPVKFCLNCSRKGLPRRWNRSPASSPVCAGTRSRSHRQVPALSQMVPAQARSRRREASGPRPPLQPAYQTATGTAPFRGAASSC
jgi:hypothetical protein